MSTQDEEIDEITSANQRLSKDLIRSMTQTAATAIRVTQLIGTAMDDAISLVMSTAETIGWEPKLTQEDKEEQMQKYRNKMRSMKELKK